MRSSFRRLLIGAAFLGLGIYTTIWSNAQTKEIERLQLLNRVTSEELQEKNKEIAKLESQPK